MEFIGIKTLDKYIKTIPYKRIPEKEGKIIFW